MEDEFWAVMRANASMLRKSVEAGQIQAVFIAIDRFLKNSGFDLPFEITSDPSGAILSFSAEGKSANAIAIDALFARVPQIEGWMIYKRKQRKSLGDAIVFVRHIYGVDADSALFSLAEVEGKFDIRAFHRDFESWSDAEMDGLVATLFEHALGEATFESNVAVAKGLKSPPPRPLSAAACVERILRFENL